MAILLLVLFAAGMNDSDTIAAISQSGRCADVADTPDTKVNPRQTVAPGPAPVLAFRYLEDKKNHRFENQDVMLDDAGH